MASSDRDVPTSSAISPALAAGVTGAGLATLVGGVASHRPELIDGVGLILGIDRFMSEARAVTNFAGNSVATLVIGTCTKSVDHDQVKLVLSGGHPLGGFETVRRLEAELGQAPVGQVPQ